MKKMIRSFIVFFIGFLFFNNIFAEDFSTSIIDIDSSQSNLLKVFFDKDISTNFDEIIGDTKLFEDLKYINIVKEIENENVVDISLVVDLENNTSYSLLSVYGAEGTIDFKINDLINGLEITGDGSTGIEKVNVIDSKNIKVTFSSNITGDDVDIKILKEYTLKKTLLDSDNNKVINITLSNKLEENSNYLLMMFSFSTNEGDSYNIANSIYDFMTKDILSEVTKVADNKEINIDNDTKTGDVALNSAETPDTGAETWILFLSTFILSNFVYFRKKFRK